MDYSDSDISSDDEFRYYKDGAGLWNKVRKSTKAVKNVVKKGNQAAKSVKKELDNARKNELVNTAWETTKAAVPQIEAAEKIAKVGYDNLDKAEKMTAMVDDMTNRMSSDPESVVKEVGGYIEKIGDLSEEIKYLKDKIDRLKNGGDDNNNDSDLEDENYEEKTGGWGPVAAFVATYAATKAADYAYDKYGGLSYLPNHDYEGGGYMTLPEGIPDYRKYLVKN